MDIATSQTLCLGLIAYGVGFMIFMAIWRPWQKPNRRK